MAQDTIRYICPICDREIRAGSHFCWNCKRIVPSPWRYTGGHLPNEAHSGCHPMQSFLRPRENRSGSHTLGKTFTQKSMAQKSVTQKSTAPRNIYQQNSTQRSGYQQKQSQNNNKNSGIGALIVVLVLFWFIIQMILRMAL